MEIQATPSLSENVPMFGSVTLHESSRMDKLKWFDDLM